MNAPLRQAERLGRLTTALGADTLALLRFDGTDHLNDLYEYQVEALAVRNDLDFDALIGTHATVEIKGREGVQHFDGIVTQARWAGVGENGHRYDLVLRPWFWLAGRRRNQRIFHNKTVVQILQELLSDYAQLGDPALEMQLSQDYPVLEYTVQYRESDLDFARRQMERHGISFHFRHAMGSHTLVLTDDVLAHDSIGARPFKSYDGHHQAEGEHFWDWSPERNITTGAIRLTDYNFKKPDQAMETDRTGDATYAQGQIESFDYPGDYLAQDVGKIVAGLRTHQERGGDRRNRAVGDCLSLRAGRRVTLSGDRIPGTGESYLCLSASQHFVSEAYGSGGQGSDGYAFTGSYTLMPDTAPMSPPRRTHVPVVQGPQTAVVVGEGEIDCDEYGRILVRFHWDLDAAHSMRCRVSQNWAGNGWGGMVIPRIGMEVLVEFLEGDPDKPIVVGNVFNGKNDAPYELPKHKTRSTFRTNSHNGKRTGRGFNELRFEDQESKEEIFMHAQKDRNEKTLHNYTARTDNNHFVSIGHMHAMEVGHNSMAHICGNYVLAVGDKVKKPISTRSERNDNQGMSAIGYRLGEYKQLPRGGGYINIESQLDTKVDAGRILTLEGDKEVMVRSSGSLDIHATGNIRSTSGETNIESIGGRKIIRSRKGIELSSGKSRLVLLPNGDIRLYGENITLSASSMFRIFSGNFMVKAKQVVDAIASRINLN